MTLILIDDEDFAIRFLSAISHFASATNFVTS